MLPTFLARGWGPVRLGNQLVTIDASVPTRGKGILHISKLNGKLNF
jgi:hypothetical protein